MCSCIYHSRYINVNCEHYFFQARDDYSNSVISYKLISGNGAELFHVEPYTGHVRVAASLADKDGSKFTLEVSVSEGGEEPSTNAIVNVSIFYIIVHALLGPVYKERGLP